MIIAIDFDGTLVEDSWPEIGRPRHDQFDRAKALKRDGHKLILWTCREDSPSGNRLTEAVEFCAKMGLYFDSVNENVTDSPFNYLGHSRKVYADKYIDDKSFKTL